MSGIRYPEEFKIEAVKQVTDRGYKIGEVAKRLGVTPKSMRDWIKKYGDTGSQQLIMQVEIISCIKRGHVLLGFNADGRVTDKCCCGRFIG